jgi:hypothetical protein
LEGVCDLGGSTEGEREFGRWLVGEAVRLARESGLSRDELIVRVKERMGVSQDFLKRFSENSFTGNKDY